MNNRYDHFANSGMRDIECQVNEAKGNARRSLLGWQDMMEDQLIKDTLGIVDKMLDDDDLSEEEFAYKTVMVLKMLVHEFASGILYAQEKLG